jgi:hypothetical protein
MSERYDFIFYSFIEAQNNYKEFINGTLNSLITNDSNYLTEIKTALSLGNVNRAIEILRSVFASVPNVLIKNTTTNEAYYHIFVHIILKLIGCEIISEYATNIGRIDAVIKFPNRIYIIEFKITTASDAMKQIINKNYQEAFMIENREIYLFGLAFDTSEKNIKKDFELIKVK